MDRDSVSEHTSVKNGSTLLSFFFLGFIFMLYALSLYGSYEFLIIRECQVLMVVRYSSRVQFLVLSEFLGWLVKGSSKIDSCI